ncbi:MAG: ATP-binding protein [Syntrophobacter sp.]
MISKHTQHKTGLIPEGGSLRANLLKLAFLPLLVVFPVVLLVLAVIGGNRYDARVEAMVRGELAIARTSLDHQRIELENFIRNQVQRESLHRLLADDNSSRQLDRMLAPRAVGVHLDFLIIADDQGKVIASNTGLIPGSVLPNSYILKQALTGILTSGFEAFEQGQLALISPRLAAKEMEGMDNDTHSSAVTGRGLLLSAAMPLPLSTSYPNAVLYGGIVLNTAATLIDRIRDVVFPLTPESEQIMGNVTLFLDDMRVVTCLEAPDGRSAIGTHAPPEVTAEVLGRGRESVLPEKLFDVSYIDAYAPITGADGTRIGMIAAGIPLAPYQTEKWLLIGSVTALLMLSMLGIAVFFQRGTRNLVSRLGNTVVAMKAVQEGRRDVRVELDDEWDEITKLKTNFNELLDALETGEEELYETTAEMELLIGSIPSILIELSSDNHFIRWNSAAERCFGVYSEVLIGAPAREGVLSWDWPKVSEAISRCRDVRKSVRLEDISFVRPDEKEGLLDLTISPIMSESNKPRGFLILGEDITERRLLERKLVQAQKLESIGQLAAGIAHEINTPAQYVGDNTRFLRDAFSDFERLLDHYRTVPAEIRNGRPLDDLVRETTAVEDEADLDYLMDEIPNAIRQSMEGVARISRIVGAMKEFSHPGTTEKTAVDINRAIESTITVARNEWKYLAEMVTDLDGTLPPVHCQPGEINQVFLNIIVNAAHAIGEANRGDGCKKGTITVATRNLGECAEIRISDTGTGIPEGIRARIFDPFFTTKEVGKGTGQGLSIAHSVVTDKHGGDISFETETGKGTTFIITLPVRDSRSRSSGDKAHGKTQTCALPADASPPVTGS